MVLKKSTQLENPKSLPTFDSKNNIVKYVMANYPKGKAEAVALLKSSLLWDGTTEVPKEATTAKLSSFASLYLLESWFPDHKAINLQAPCASGKSTLAYIMTIMNDEKVLNLVIFRTEMFGFVERMWTAAGVSTYAISSEAYLVEEDIITLEKKLTMASYQNLYLKVWLKHIHPDLDVNDMTDKQLEAKIISSIEGKVIAIDEADFIITQIIAETKPSYDPINKKVLESFDAIYDRKIAALISLYTLFTKYARKVVFMSATTNKKFDQIMSAIGAKTVTPSFLENEYAKRNGRAVRINSYNLASITNLFYLEKRIDESMNLSDYIIVDKVAKFPNRKTLFYSVRAGIVRIAAITTLAISQGLKVCIIIDEDRLRQGWNNYNGKEDSLHQWDNKLTRLENFRASVLKHVQAKFAFPIEDKFNEHFTLKQSGEEVAEVFNNEVFQTHDLVFISTNGARAVSITCLEGEDVQVITDESPTNSEVVQAWARFRLANVHVINLYRLNRSRFEQLRKNYQAIGENNEIKKRDYLMDDPDSLEFVLENFTFKEMKEEKSSYSEQMSASLAYFKNYFEVSRINNSHIACVDAQVQGSNLPVWINVDLSYLEKEVTSRDLPDYAKTKRIGKAIGKSKGKAIGKAINDDTTTKLRNRLINSLLESNPKISTEEVNKELVKHNFKPASKPLMAKLRKEIKQKTQKEI